MATEAIHVGAPSLTSLPAAVNSELLCFIVDRSKIMRFMTLWKYAVIFYTEEEIVALRDVIIACSANPMGLAYQNGQE